MAGVIEAPRNLDYIRNTVVDRAKAFPQEFLKGVPLRVTDMTTIDLVDDLQSGRFWGVLYALDGSSNPQRIDAPEIKEEKRAWSRDMFKPDEINKLAQLSVDMAIAAPSETSWPGTRHAHSVLYHALVEENPGSLFEGKVSESLKNRIINGTFWELIPEIDPALNYGMGIRSMENILKENYDELDIQFAQFGYDLFKRNHGEFVDPTLVYMAEKPLQKYIRFMRNVEREHEVLGLELEQMNHIMEPIRRAGTPQQRAEERYMLREIGSLA